MFNGRNLLFKSVSNLLQMSFGMLYIGYHTSEIENRDMPIKIQNNQYSFKKLSGTKGIPESIFIRTLA